MKKQILLFVAVVFALYIQAQTYTVGIQTVSYTDASRSNRAVGVEFRYPGTNLALATGQFPFVIFAHGFQMDQVPGKVLLVVVSVSRIIVFGHVFLLGR